MRARAVDSKVCTHRVDRRQQQFSVCSDRERTWLDLILCRCCSTADERENAKSNQVRGSSGCQVDCGPECTIATCARRQRRGPYMPHLTTGVVGHNATGGCDHRGRPHALARDQPVPGDGVLAHVRKQPSTQRQRTESNKPRDAGSAVRCFRSPPSPPLPLLHDPRAALQVALIYARWLALPSCSIPHGA